MDQKKSHLAFQGVTHFLGLERGLVDIDGNISLKNSSDVRRPTSDLGRRTDVDVVPEGDDIGGAIDPAKPAIELLNAFMPADFHRELHRAAYLFEGKRIGRQPLKVVAGVGASGNSSGFKKGDVRA